MLLALIVLPETIRVAVRFATPLPITMGPGRHAREWYLPDIRDSLQAITQYSAFHVLMARAVTMVPASECIYAIKPALVSLFIGRQVFIPPLPNLSNQEFDSALAQHRCRYFLMLNMPTPTFPYVMYPYTRIADKIRVISKVKNTLIPGSDAGALAKWITPPGATETGKATLPTTH
jgi:hypothetical protein